MGTKADLETHISKQDGCVASCGECGKTFDDTQSCEEHIETAHLMPQQCEPFPCDECGLVLVCYNFQKNVQKNDPAQIKHHLSEHGNRVLDDLWLSKGFQNHAEKHLGLGSLPQRVTMKCI